MKNVLCVIFFILFTTTLFAQNNCLEFDGSEDYVALGSEGSFDFADQMTIEAWLNVDSFPYDWTAIVTKGDNAWKLHAQDNGKIYFSVDGGNAAISTYSVEGIGWVHVAGVAVGTNLYLYLNGKLDNTASYDGSFDVGNHAVYIGENAQSTGRYFDGLMDEVRIWSDDRSVNEIRQNMYRELNGDEDGLVAYYKFNEESGLNADDSKSGGNIDGTLTNMAGNEWRNSGAFAGPRRCLDFDGSDDYVDCGTFDSFCPGSGSFTIETWIKPDVLSGNKRIIWKNDGSEPPFNGYYIMTSGTTLSAEFSDNSNYINVYGGTLTVGSWSHIALVRDISEDEIRLYMNGVEIDKETDNTSNIICSGNMGVGGRTDMTAEMFDGQIDEVRIWDDARTAEEIQNNMCRSLAGNEADLVAYYRFDQQPTSGQTTLYDITSNEYTGTLHNMDTADWVSCTAFDTWIGWLSTSWGESKNWSRSVPDNTENVGIFKWTLGHAPTVGSSSSAKTLVIGLLETLTLNSGLTIDGNLFELGNLLHNNQTVTCEGSGAQYLVGSLNFYDLTINNSSSDKKVSAWWTTLLQVDNTLTVTDGVFYSKSDYTNVSIASEGTLELSGDITVSGNWDNDGTFTHNNHRVTFDGLSAQTIQGDHSTTFHDCTVANTSGVVLGNSNTVNNTLDLNNDSKITLGSSTLTIGSSGSVTNYDADSYVVTNGSGVLKRNSVGSGSTAFPIGNSSYNPIWINNSGTADNFSVKVADGTPSNISDATRVVNRTWTITEDVASESDATITLQWNSGETGGNFNISDQLVMGRYLGSGTSWETKSATGTDTDPIFKAEAIGFTSFSDFVVASGGSGTLPVVLSAFTAQYLENTPTIHWSTQSESDNMGWFIFRSEENDFSSSEIISEMIEGHGTTTQQQNYVYEDRIQESEVGDTYYYWLESIDYSGIIHHYNKVAILTIPDNGNSNNSGVAEPERFGLLQNEPNPVISSTRISFNLNETAQVDLAIYNLKGQLVKHLYSGNSSKHTVMWDGKDEQGNDLKAGVYLYKLLVNGKTAETKKLILMR
jgi:hypothetical protein